MALLSIYTNSDWTQTIVAVDPHWLRFSFLPVQVAVGSGQWADFGSSAGTVHWSSPGSIPPHSVRVLRVLWKSDLCIGTEGWTSTQDVVLTVRVGIFTKTEDVPLLASFALSGTKASSECH